MRRGVDVYLLCGLPFSGKSTLAAALARHAGAEVVALDAINAARGLHGGTGIPVEEWARTHREALERVEAFLAQGRSVVVDDTCCYRFLRDDHRAVAVRHGAAVTIVHLDRPLELLLARLRANQRTRSRPPVLEEVLLDLARRFEPPGPGERVLDYPEGAPAEAWIAAHVPVTKDAHGD